MKNLYPTLLLKEHTRSPAQLYSAPTPKTGLQV
jgi:hypothetical protein